ncbi:MAG: hypothetical protein HYR88_02425, partial [Verrucomicrobia bacterium]|nr:hypothetical protein [Verrucomicrobiota bacterium]
ANSLALTYAWMILLRSGGLLDRAAQSLSLLSREDTLGWLYTPGAIFTGLVYVYLPFMVYCAYASIEKFDWRLLEAAQDLGATRTRAMLRYGDAKALAWKEANGDVWRLYWLRWDPGRNSAQLARAHTPEICLTGAGGQIVHRWPRQNFSAAGLDLAFDQYEFRFGQREMHVFYCLWQDREAAVGPAGLATASDDGSAMSRVRAAWAGRRNLGQTVLEVAVVGPRDAEEARSALKQQLSKWVSKSSAAGAVFEKSPE